MFILNSLWSGLEVIVDMIIEFFRYLRYFSLGYHNVFDLIWIEIKKIFSSGSLHSILKMIILNICINSLKGGMMYFISISFTIAYQQLHIPLETYTSSLAQVSILTVVHFHFPELYNLLCQIFSRKFWHCKGCRIAINGNKRYIQ